MEEPFALGPKRPTRGFAPRARPALAAACSYGGAPPSVVRAARALAHLFTGRRTGICEQTESMGRGCFRRLGAKGSLVAKGIGPSPQSERLRGRLDDLLRRGGAGGCLRLETGTSYPLLVKFQQQAGVWDIADPRPEGFSMFSDLVRDAEAARLCALLGLKTVAPVILLRDSVAAPWRTTPAGLESFLRLRLPGALASHLGRCDDAPPLEALRIRSLAYYHLDGGTLIRFACSPFRVSDLQRAAAACDGDSLAALVTAMPGAMGPGANRKASDPGLAFATELGRTAAGLFFEGVIHGQLGLHFQNVTLAGEVADLDSTIFLRLARHLVAAPFPESPGEAMYRRFWQRLKTRDEAWRLNLAAELGHSYRRVGIGNYEIDEASFAASMLLEVHALYLHALRAADLVERSRIGVAADLARPGTVLDPARTQEVRNGFAQAFVAALVERGAGPLLAWSIRRGYARLLEDRLALAGSVTLFGWTAPSVPINHLEVRCDGLREAVARQEAEDLFHAVDSSRRLHGRAGLAVKHGLRQAATHATDPGADRRAS